jgi:hypothetical protein
LAGARIDEHRLIRCRWIHRNDSSQKDCIMNCLIAYADGGRVASEAQVPDVDVKIPGGQIEPSLRTQRDVEVTAGVVLKRAITKSRVIGSC